MQNADCRISSRIITTAHQQWQQNVHLIKYSIIKVLQRDPTPKTQYIKFILPHLYEACLNYMCSKS